MKKWLKWRHHRGGYGVLTAGWHHGRKLSGKRCSLSVILVANRRLIEMAKESSAGG